MIISSPLSIPPRPTDDSPPGTSSFVVPSIGHQCVGPGRGRGSHQDRPPRRRIIHSFLLSSLTREPHTAQASLIDLQTDRPREELADTCIRSDDEPNLVCLLTPGTHAYMAVVHCLPFDSVFLFGRSACHMCIYFLINALCHDLRTLLSWWPIRSREVGIQPTVQIIRSLDDNQLGKFAQLFFLPFLHDS